MSEQLCLWRDGQPYPENGVGRQSFRASIAREMRYLLAISTDASKPNSVRPAGIAHSLGVCLIEDSNMARGGKGGNRPAATNAMPRFVDVKLTAEDRVAFKAWEGNDAGLVAALQGLADEGYRVGVSWSGEHSSYTVSLTCRDSESPNNGLCMTSFAGLLATALWLAVYKHRVLTGGCWEENAAGGGEAFG